MMDAAVEAVCVTFDALMFDNPLMESIWLMKLLAFWLVMRPADELMRPLVNALR